MLTLQRLVDKIKGIMDKYALYGEIGSKIRNIRKAKGFTQQCLADKINVKRTSITNFESGKQCPPLHLIYELCNFLDIDIYEILPNNSNRKIDQEKVEIQSATGTVKISKKTHEIIEKIKNSKEREKSLQKIKQAMEQYGL